MTVAQSDQEAHLILLLMREEDVLSYRGNLIKVRGEHRNSDTSRRERGEGQRKQLEEN